MIVVWLQRARIERERAIDYIAERNLSAALDQLAEVEAQLELLRDFPELGRPGRRRGTRELVVTGTPFLAIYRIRSKLRRIEVLHFVHGAQRWPPRPSR